ncbi:MAG: DUF429 domain-containing protein [Anaerolineae bacterium]
MPNSSIDLVAIGIDLAWSARNDTGIAALRWSESDRAAHLIDCRLARTDEDILTAVKSVDYPNIVVAIDAPTVVPNREGRRPADSKISAAFRRFHAGAYPANRRLLATHQGEQVRGEVIARRLESELQIIHRAEINPRAAIRQCFEAFPHPAMVVLFQLERTLPYKARVARSLADRLTAFAEYHRLIRDQLTALEPAVQITDSFVTLLADLPRTPAALKRHEDQLDALLCAYIALYYWYWGAERCYIFGNFHEGYTVTPVDDRIAKL